VGLLDDAIREHLELKKAHGASAEEVDHLAQEVLGPARREAEADGDEPQSVAEEPPAEVAAPEPVAVETAEAEAEAEPVIPSAGELDDATPEPESAAPAWELSDEEPEPAVLEEEEEVEGEDVLEETPEFLQETPEHDRLWFEQKPPRDFDFDH
jgi:hypothetical protein